MSEAFCRALHRRMFDQTWRWAGQFQPSDKKIGCDWGERNLVDRGIARQSYIAALRAADAGDLQPLMVFVRS